MHIGGGTIQLSDVNNHMTAICKIEYGRRYSYISVCIRIYELWLGIVLNTSSIPYIGNHSRKKTFANFADFGMIANVFLLPFLSCDYF